MRRGGGGAVVAPPPPRGYPPGGKGRPDPPRGPAPPRGGAAPAESLARDYARRARGAGRSWDEVAAALKFDAAGHDDPSVEAFLWVAPTPSQRFDSIVTSWECASCAARVTDRGPFGGHPEEVEEGHLDSCARHQEDISAYRQQTGWDD